MILITIVFGTFVGVRDAKQIKARLSSQAKRTLKKRNEAPAGIFQPQRPH